MIIKRLPPRKIDIPECEGCKALEAELDFAQLQLFDALEFPEKAGGWKVLLEEDYTGHRIAAYLHSRGLLEHHPEHSDWVRITEKKLTAFAPD